MVNFRKITMIVINYSLLAGNKNLWNAYVL